jgi:anthranilate synthase component 1
MDEHEIEAGQLSLDGLLHKEIALDLETPASLFLRIRGLPGAFLLESVERGQAVGRYSFAGCDPLFTVSAAADGWTLQGPGGRLRLGQGGLPVLRRVLRACSLDLPASLPPFAGGLIGYIGYDAVRWQERLPKPPPDDRGLPVAQLTYPGILFALDHASNTLHVIVRGDATASAPRRLEQALDLLHSQPQAPDSPAAPAPASSHAANLSEGRYRQMVLSAKDYIRQGDIFQVVLSQRLQRPLTVDPFQAYRALRRLNPSPYMFFLQFEPDLVLIGSSPEMLVRLQGNLAEQRPLAGTRPRGRSFEEDQALAAELCADEKERAEHVMLVDLARNDLGRVCRYGSVSVPTLLETERFSHVMHLVSHVQGLLRPDADAVDLLAACLPAGTVSGAPKVRAMEIIDELEPTRRGPYAGAVGYLDIRGNMDTCIAIRTIVAHGGVAYVQAGAGIVADSDPAREYQETLNKALAPLRALDIAAESGASAPTADVLMASNG